MADVTGGVPVDVIVAVAVLLQLPLETVTVYVPTPSPDAVAALPPEGAQLYVNGPVPVVTLTVAVPVLPPQVVGVVEVESTNPELATVTLIVIESSGQLTINFTAYVPAAPKVCEGFCVEDVPPSPKLHDHAFGVHGPLCQIQEPVVASVNVTALQAPTTYVKLGFTIGFK